MDGNLICDLVAEQNDAIRILLSCNLTAQERTVAVLKYRLLMKRVNAVIKENEEWRQKVMKGLVSSVKDAWNAFKHIECPDEVERIKSIVQTVGKELTGLKSSGTSAITKSELEGIVYRELYRRGDGRVCYDDLPTCVVGLVAEEKISIKDDLVTIF